MNLNQSAHGDREFAFIQSRLGRGRKTIVGHWDDAAVAGRLGWWTRAAAGWHEVAAAADRPLRRQHARGRGHRGRQGRGPGAARVRRQRLRRKRAGGRGRRRVGRPRSTALVARVRSEPTTSSPALRSGGDRHDELRYAARIEVALRSLPRGRRFRRIHRHLRGPRRAAPAARHRRPAPHGRRLRLRRRGRLEDGGAGAHPQGHGARACPAARHSWRTTPTTSAIRSPRSSARTCSRSVRRSRTATPRARSTRSRSAAVRTRSGSCSTRPRARRSSWGWPISAGGSG